MAGILVIYFISMTEDEKIKLFSEKSSEYAKLSNDIQIVLLAIITERLMNMFNI